MRKRHILVDIDGVLLDWLAGFEKYNAGLPENLSHIEKFESSHQNFLVEVSDTTQAIRDYNGSPEIEYTPPYQDAVDYIKKLASYGFKFTTISSSGESLQLKIRRQRGLEKLFGRVFIDHHFTDLFASKEKYLAIYHDSGLPWIEDHYGNAKTGARYGLRSYLIRSPHNSKFDLRDRDIIEIPQDDSWYSIYFDILKYYNIKE